MKPITEAFGELIYWADKFSLAHKECQSFKKVSEFAVILSRDDSFLAFTRMKLETAIAIFLVESKRGAYRE